MGAPFHVNGAAAVNYAGALLGYGLDGVEEEYAPAHHDVMFDVAGGSGGKPGDVQFLNEDCTISIALTAINFAVLKQAILNSRAGGTPGTMPASGILLGANGYLKPLTILSPLGGKPVTFPTTWLIAPTRFPKGTVNSIIAVTFRAIPYSGGADSLSGAKLYSGGF